MKVSRVIVMMILGMVLFSCSPRVNYIGSTNEPTHEVDVYFSEGDIQRDYQVMGIMDNNKACNLSKINKAFVKKAKSMGADAILIKDVNYVDGGRRPMFGVNVTNQPNILLVDQNRKTERIVEAELISYLD